MGGTNHIMEAPGLGAEWEAQFGPDMANQDMEDRLYTKVAHIGEGSYADVYLATPRKNPFAKKKYVIKELDVMSMEEKDQKKALLEVNILSTLKHPNIIGYKESYLHDGFLCIVMEHADGGDIFHHISQARELGYYIDESIIVSWLAQILLSLEYVHANQLLHRDIKPQNIFLMANGMVKLGDFGVSRVLDDPMALVKTTTGTPCYFSPELCRNEPYNAKSDIWALGSITYEMASLMPPFPSEDMAQMCEDICSAEPYPLPEHYSNDLRVAIKMMMEKDPDRRPTAQQLLRMPMLRKVCRRLPWARAQTTACAGDERKRRKKRNKQRAPTSVGKSRKGKPAALPTLNQEEVHMAMRMQQKHQMAGSRAALPSIGELCDELSEETKLMPIHEEADGDGVQLHEVDETRQCDGEELFDIELSNVSGHAEELGVGECGEEPVQGNFLGECGDTGGTSNGMDGIRTNRDVLFQPSSS